jgi:hypothetical protein
MHIDQVQDGMEKVGLIKRVCILELVGVDRQAGAVLQGVSGKTLVKRSDSLF